MLRIKKFVGLCACALLMVACGQKGQISSDATIVNAPLLSPSRTEKFDFFDFWGECDVVFLDNTSEESLIGTVTEEKLISDTLFLKSNSAIYMFKTDGSFIRKIQHKGRGHGEYLTLSDFDIDASRKELFILDDDLHKMLVYSFEGQFKRQFEVADLSEDFSVFPNGDFLFYCFNKYDGMHRGLWQTDSVGKFKKQLITIDDSFEFGITLDTYLVHLCPDKIGFMGAEDYNNFYTITPDTIEVSYTVQTDIVLSGKTKKNHFFDFANNPDGAFLKAGYVESEEKMSFILTNIQNSVIVYIDKVDNKIYRVYDNSDIIQTEGRPIPRFGDCYNGVFISAISAESMLSNPIFKEAYPEINETSNPVVFMTRHPYH